MNKFCLFTVTILLSIFSAITAQAEVLKTVNSSTAGSLATTLTVTELATVTNLTITGTIDTRDFKTMRDNMPALTSIDLSTATIAEYTGTDGTGPSGVYPADEVPQCAFFYPFRWNGKTTLISIILPASITSIGNQAFQKCSGLTSITIPASVTSIGNDVFNSCSSLTSITIPASVATIGTGAFAGCKGLTSVTIPAAVSSIGDHAFFDCSGSITVEEANSDYSSADGLLFNKAQTTLIQCPVSKTGGYAIPTTVTSIANYAFSYCSGLTSVVIPSSVNTIGRSIFSDCTGLTSVTIPASVTSIVDDAFYNCSGLTSIAIPASVTSIGDNAFSRCGGSIIVDKANPKYSSADGILFNKAQTTLIQCTVSKTGSYTIPSTVTSIGSFAFDSCTGLTSVAIPASVNSIGEWAFSFCSGLTSVTIPASVFSIGNGAFQFCSGLTSVSIPAWVTSIGNFAFSDCSSLTSVYANATTPVNINSMVSVFDNVNKNTCTLYVPKGSKPAYQVFLHWKDFTNIVEMTTGVNDQLVNEPYIYSQEGALYIENVEANSIVKVYDTTGKIRYSGKMRNSSMNIELTKDCIYLVQINSRSYKIIL